MCDRLGNLNTDIAISASLLGIANVANVGYIEISSTVIEYSIRTHYNLKYTLFTKILVEYHLNKFIDVGVLNPSYRCAETYCCD